MFSPRSRIAVPFLFLFAAAFLFGVAPVQAQDEDPGDDDGDVSAQARQDTVPEFGWKPTANGNANLSQAYFDNWTRGGTDALTWEVRLEGGVLEKRPAYDWETRGRGTYGQSRLGELGTRKASDELMFETVYTRKVSEWVNPFAAVRFQSQFAAGYDYDDTLGTSERVSGVFDPAYLTQTLGLEKSWEDAYRVRVGGGLKQTFSAARYGYADDPETAPIETFRVEPGASINLEARRGIMEDILLTSMLDIFVNFRGVDEVNVRWENQVAAKVNSRISANFGFDLLYDKSLSTRRQIHQSLSVGVSFLSI